MMNPFTSESEKSELEPRNPGIGKIVLGALLLIGGPFALFVWFFVAIFTSSGSDYQFIAPGEFEMLVEDPGNFTLWNSYAVSYEGKRYSSGPDLPHGMEIAVFAENRSELAFIPRTGTSVSSGSEAKESVGYVKVEDPGFIRFLVSGDFEKRVFSVSKGGPGDIFRILLISILVGAASVIAGIIFLVLGLVAYSNARNAQKSRERSGG